MDFSKAKIIKGLTETKTMHPKHIIGHIHESQGKQQNRSDVVSKGTANIYPSNKYDFFPVILSLTKHETLNNLNIVLSFHEPFEPITALLTITGL